MASNVASQKDLTMRKLFLDKINGDEIIITGDEHKHIAYSLRMRVGDEITVCAGGVDYTAVIDKITKDSAVAKIVGKARNISEPDHNITLFFGAMKGDKNDFVVQKCTELGVLKFVPFISSYSSVKSENIKTERLNRIALEASKQSGRGIVPEVAPTTTFNDLLDLLADFDTVVFPYERAENGDLGDIVKQNKTAKNIAVIIGSEGGFSKAEVEKLQEGKVMPITLGDRILRADTACVAVCSTLFYLLGEWKRK